MCASSPGPKTKKRNEIAGKKRDAWAAKPLSLSAARPGAQRAGSFAATPRPSLPPALLPAPPLVAVLLLRLHEAEELGHHVRGLVLVPLRWRARGPAQGSSPAAAYGDDTRGKSAPRLCIWPSNQTGRRCRTWACLAMPCGERVKRRPAATAAAVTKEERFARKRREQQQSVKEGRRLLPDTGASRRRTEGGNWNHDVKPKAAFGLLLVDGARVLRLHDLTLLFLRQLHVLPQAPGWKEQRSERGGPRGAFQGRGRRGGKAAGGCALAPWQPPACACSRPGWTCRSFGPRASPFASGKRFPSRRPSTRRWRG